MILGTTVAHISLIITYIGGNMDTVICNCTGVTKGTIVTAIKEKSLTSVGQVADATESSTFCGTCADHIEEILTEING